MRKHIDMIDQFMTFIIATFCLGILSVFTILIIYGSTPKYVVQRTNLFGILLGVGTCSIILTMIVIYLLSIYKK